MNTPGTTGAGPPRGTAAGQHSIRDHNLALVLQHIAAAEETSRATLAEITGLNKSTVSNLAGQLLARGLITEHGVRAEGQVGRPPIRIRLARAPWVALGIEVNVDYLAAMLVDLTGAVVAQAFEVVDNRSRPPADVLAQANRLARRVVDTPDDQQLQIIGAGVGLPGLVDPATGHVINAPNIAWRDVDVSDVLTDVVGDDRVTRIDNEANLAALAERWRGAGTTLRSFIQVSGEVGVGAGLLLDDHLLRGTSGFAGEFGHMTLVMDGPPCRCGSTGCVETLVGLEPLLRRTGFDPDVALADAREAESGVAGTIARRARDGDGEVLDGLAETGRLLGVALASSVNLLGPQAVVLGGYFTLLHRWIAPQVREELQRRVLAVPPAPTPVIASQLGRGAAVRGAAESALRAVFADPVHVPEAATQ